MDALNIRVTKIYNIAVNFFIEYPPFSLILYNNHKTIQISGLIIFSS